MKYLIIGGNAAGMSFASKMRRNDKDAEIVIIEKRDYVSFGSCGLPYLLDGKVKDVDDLLVKSPEAFREEGIDLRIEEYATNIMFADKRVRIKKLDHSTYFENYDKLIIATGAAPFVLPGVDVDEKHIFTLTTKYDGTYLKNTLEDKENLNIAIVGSGFIGLEVMDVLQEKHNVSVFTNTSQILDGLYDKELLEGVEKEINEHPNIKMNYDAQVKSIKSNKDNATLVLNDEELIFDIVVMAIGFKPVTNFVLDEEEGGVEKIGNGAIKTDKYGKTSKDDIYAIGDCATVWNPILEDVQYLPLATNANKLGRMLADHLAGETTYYEGSLGTSSLKVLNYEFARTGLTKGQLDNSNFKYKTKIVKDYTKPGYYPGSKEIMGKVFYEEETLRILGCELSGESDVVDKIDVMSLAIANKMSTKQLGYADFAYAPPFSRTWSFLNVLGNVSK